MAEKEPSPPALWKNSFFWFAGILFILSILGLIFGNDFIRDPGQVHESWLWAIYLCAAVVMGANGWIVHRANLRDFRGE